jgi:hypothetical protein
VPALLHLALLAQPLSELLQVVDEDYATRWTALAKTAPLVGLFEARDTTEVLARFARELGQGDRAADGPATALHAWVLVRVEMLLPPPERVAGSSWFGPLLAHDSLDLLALQAMGVDGPVRAPLVDVALRAAAATGATERLLADQLPCGCGPSGGIGALLRYAGQPGAR